jgi:hypothetical protein
MTCDPLTAIEERHGAARQDGSGRTLDVQLGPIAFGFAALRISAWANNADAAQPRGAERQAPKDGPREASIEADQ